MVNQGNVLLTCWLCLSFKKYFMKRDRQTLAVFIYEKLIGTRFEPRRFKECGSGEHPMTPLDKKYLLWNERVSKNVDLLNTPITPLEWTPWVRHQTTHYWFKCHRPNSNTVGTFLSNISQVLSLSFDEMENGLLVHWGDMALFVDWNSKLCVLWLNELSAWFVLYPCVWSVCDAKSIW